MVKKLFLLAAFLFMTAATACLFMNASVYIAGLLAAGALCCFGAYFNVE